MCKREVFSFLQCSAVGWCVWLFNSAEVMLGVTPDTYTLDNRKLSTENHTHTQQNSCHPSHSPMGRPVSFTVSFTDLMLVLHYWWILTPNNKESCSQIIFNFISRKTISDMISLCRPSHLLTIPSWWVCDLPYRRCALYTRIFTAAVSHKNGYNDAPDTIPMSLLRHTHLCL